MENKRKPMRKRLCGWTDDEVVRAVEKVKEEWDETYAQTQTRVKSIEEYGKGTLDLLAPQMPTQEDVSNQVVVFKSWKDQYQSLHLGLRNANLQKKANIRKARLPRGNFF
ncbi:hypothetical protein IFM89_031561 [Coptis chinensis]|uniref:Uncharacterized protein n=1 Tax=Coptis chinensis TaxID=261450 RepID=A0A835HQW0_9MAGN|nr:hypothetical protein IFM89_031561 [Coptis chinensis]